MIKLDRLPNHWLPAGDQAKRLKEELARELPPGHVLDGVAATAIARRTDCDDVLFALSDDRFAVVHLTWSGSQETDPTWPATTIHETVQLWREADAAEQAAVA